MKSVAVLLGVSLVLVNWVKAEEKVPSSQGGLTLRFAMQGDVHSFHRVPKDYLLRDKIVGASRKFLAFVEPRLNLTPFHQMGELVPESPRALPNLTPYNALNTYLSGAAGFLASAAVALREPKWLKHAEFQIQWVLGRNPRRVCMVEGMGWKTPGAIMSYLAFTREKPQRLIPRGVAKGNTSSTRLGS